MANEIIWHKHHIIPKHMGGTDDPSNIIRVNVAMHAFLHKCLFEEFGRWQDKVAWQMLSGQITLSEAKLLAIKEGASKAGKKNKGRAKPWLKGKPLSPEHKAKIGAGNKGVKKPKSDEWRKRQSECMKGRPTPFFKGHVPWNKGKTGIYSEETLKKMSAPKRR